MKTSLHILTTLVTILQLCNCQQQNEPVALVIAGVEKCINDCQTKQWEISGKQSECQNVPNYNQLTSVEIFGCPSGQNYSTIANLPTTMVEGAATYWPEFHTVLACGGLSCYGGEDYLEGPSDQCSFWNPAQNLWFPTDTMQRPRANYLMTLIDDPSGPNPYQIPYIVGGYSFSESANNYYPVYETDYLNGNGWQQSLNYPSSRIGQWPLLRGDGCIVQIEDYIYEFGRDDQEDDRLYLIDIKNGSSVDLGIDVDWKGCSDYCQCVPYAIEDHQGIFLSVGNWLNLTDLSWTSLTPLTSTIEASSTDYSLVSFRGVPTGFNYNRNFPYISGKEVMRYDLATDSWTSIGNLTTARSAATIVEVPGEFCDWLAN